ncbi:MAG: electron transfer flavoprotein subunit beta/FixA family protein [Candidatus Excrementavichristensenella sp.]|jgi:electron transfer flavoprotein beta subunit
MRIYACVKQVPANNETRLDPVTGTLIREGSPGVLNPLDAYAVEQALRLKEQYGGEVSALSMGVPGVRDMLRRVVALGVDRGILLTDRAFAGSDTLATARVLAAAVNKCGMPDLILCGRVASDGDTAQVGPMLAECLGIPHVSDVACIEEIARGEARVRRLGDRGYHSLRVRLPALFTVLKEICVPRLPSITGVLRGEKAAIAVWGRADLGSLEGGVGLKGSNTRVLRSHRPDLRVKTRAVAGARDLMDILREENLIAEDRDRGGI